MSIKARLVIRKKRHTMANRTLRKHPMIDIIETHTPLPSAAKEDISNTPIEISSDLLSEIIENQQGYWERVGHPVDDASALT